MIKKHSRTIEPSQSSTRSRTEYFSPSWHRGEKVLISTRSRNELQVKDFTPEQLFRLTQKRNGTDIDQSFSASQIRQNIIILFYDYFCYCEWTGSRVSDEVFRLKYLAYEKEIEIVYFNELQTSVGPVQDVFDRCTTSDFAILRKRLKCGNNKGFQPLDAVEEAFKTGLKPRLPWQPLYAIRKGSILQSFAF